MKVLKTPSEGRNPRRLTVAIAALGGGRKTTLGAHLPGFAGEPGWTTKSGAPGRILYVAADKTSPELASIHPRDLERLVIVIPDGNARRDPRSGALLTDWKREMGTICQRDWKAEEPDLVAIVYDTVTAHAGKVLLENMEMGFFSEKGPSSAEVGPSDPRFKFEKETGIALGDMGDYRMVKEYTLRQLDWLLDMNSDLHVITLWQEGMSDKGKDGQGMVIGPSICGRTGPKEVPYHFNNVLHLTPDGDKGTRVQCQSAQAIVACIKTTRGREVPLYKWVDTANPDACRAFWLWMQQLREGAPTKPAATEAAVTKGD